MGGRPAGAGSVNTCKCGCGKPTSGTWASGHHWRDPDIRRRASAAMLASRGTESRNRAVVERFLEHAETLEEIGRAFGVSRERVRQILQSNGVSDDQRARVWDARKRKRRYVGDYVLVYRPSHHRAGTDGKVPEHILVAEKKSGRPISADEHVHHINGDRHDNRPDNLAVLTPAEHMRLHNKRWTKAAFLDLLRWLAIRTGRTPIQSDMNAPGHPGCHMNCVHLFGSMSAAQAAAGLTPNGRGTPGHGGKPLSPMFRKRFGHLARYPTAQAMLDDLHDGLRTEHEKTNAASEEAAA